MAVACRDVEAATLARDGSPPITRTTFPTCRAHYPGGSSGCACRLLPRSRGLPQMAGGSASALSLSRPAQASLTLRPVGLLSRLRRPLSRGSSPSGYPAEPLVSYQINRQLSGWSLPPLVIRAFGAHCQQWTFSDAARPWPATISRTALPRKPDRSTFFRDQLFSETNFSFRAIKRLMGHYQILGQGGPLHRTARTVSGNCFASKCPHGHPR